MNKKSPYETTATEHWLDAATGGVKRFYYRTGEAKKLIPCGTTKLYELINTGKLEARRFGRLTMITGESLEALVASLPRVETPTMLRAKHAKRSGQRKPRAKPQEEPGAAE